MRSLTLPSLLAAAFLAASAPPTAAQLVLPRVSPKASVQQSIGVTDLGVTYCRPGVKGREIWGGLVPYDQPWRTGANEATTFTTSGEIQFGGRTLAAGSYSLVTIPGKQEWTVALNSEKNLWRGAEYDPAKDILRITARPGSAEHREWMQFTFEDLTPTSANLVLRWEKLKLDVPITVDVNRTTLGNAREAMAKLAADDWRTPYQAANFTFTNEVALDEGRGWLEKSIATQPNYQNLTLLARWQMKEGKKKDAITTAKKAIAAGKESKDPVDTAATEKLIAEWTGTGAR
jgi:hypothetical protein